MRQYSGNNLSVVKTVENYGHSTARGFIERPFRILTNKCRILHRPLNGSVDFIQNVVKACVILQNSVNKRGGFRFEYTLSYEGLQNIFG